MQRLLNVAVHVGAAVLLALPVIAVAQFFPPGSTAAGVPHMSMQAEPHGPPFGGPDVGGTLHHPLLRGLKLDDLQADKVFAILHEQALAVRNAQKALRQANQELRALTLSGAYDGAKARVLADAAGRATGELAILHADADHRIWTLLTEEQRGQVEVIQQPVRSRP